MLAYLRYLEYLRSPEYAKFIQYPQCLHHLELVTASESFREAIQHDATAGELAKGSIEHWRTWREPKLEPLDKDARYDEQLQPQGASR